MLTEKDEIKVRIELTNLNYFSAVKRMLNVLLPELEVLKEGLAEIVIDNRLEASRDQIEVETQLTGPEDSLKRREIDTEIQDFRYTEKDFRRRCKNKVKLHIYQLLTEYLNVSPSPWGILIGVRPTKIGHFLLDRGFNYEEIEEHLLKHYGIKQQKVDLMLEIVEEERKYLPTKEEAGKKVNIYLGIPFCPSRCGYCSFPAYGLNQWGKYLESFLKSLYYEITEVGNWLDEKNIKIDTIYFGGGTPTILNSQQLKELLTKVTDNFWQPGVREFSIEAGRPDTITKEKLELLKQYQVNRISINPQTMNQETLDKIGRNHTVAEVKEKFKLARRIGFENINMDLIIGLPGEDVSDFVHTVREIAGLNPDSLTVHTMAIKRASKWKRKLAEIDFPDKEEVQEMFKISQNLAHELNMAPYYMYRQKYMLDNLENIGYSRSGLESIYNIIMMEERATVIGLGSGAATKLVKPSDWKFDKLYNPKAPKDYIEQVEERTLSKLGRLTSLFK